MKTGTGGGLVDTDISDSEEVTVLSHEEKQKMDKRLQREKDIMAEFAGLEYAVEWYVHFEGIQVHIDTSYYNMHGLSKIDFPKEYEAMTAKGIEHGVQEGKLINLVYVNATLTNHGKDKQVCRLDGNDIAKVWDLKMIRAMRHKHSNKPLRSTVSFKVLVEFWYSRTKTGVIPEHIKPPIPPTQSQIKAKATQDKSEQIARLELNANERLEAQELQIVQCQKCTWKSCPNFAGGQCLELNGHHYQLLPPHIRTWAQAIASKNATPSRPPASFHQKAFLKRWDQSGHKSPKGKKKTEESASPIPISTPMQTPTRCLKCLSDCQTLELHHHLYCHRLPCLLLTQSGLVGIRICCKMVIRSLSILGHLPHFPHLSLF